MTINEQEITLMVKEVLAKLNSDKITVSNLGNGVFDDVSKAIDAALYSQKIVNNLSFAQRGAIIDNIKKATIDNAQILAEYGVNETGMGNVAHKVAKHILTAEKTPGVEDISTVAWTGDFGLTLVEQSAFGVIGAVTPATNPSETIICNTIGMIAGGNTVVFNPHPNAKQTSAYTVDMINKASMEVGGPNNICVCVANPTLESGDVIFKHKDVPLLVATGGPGVVTVILSSGKRGIGAGAGNPPVFVDDTADLVKAAADIINGATFDNNLPCIAEKEIIAISSITDELKYYLQQNGAYELTLEQADLLATKVLVTKNNKHILNRDCVGRDAKYLLSLINIDVEDNVRCIIFEGDATHILIAEELMMPILGIVIVDNVDDGIKCALALEAGNRHSSHMHSKNIDNLTRYGKALATAIFVKNGPSYNALGFGGEGFCTFTIASRTGEGLTSARTFTKARRCVMSDSLCIR